MGHSRTLGYAAAVAAALTGSFSSAEMLPSQIDLRAGYCLGFLENQQLNEAEFQHISPAYGAAAQTANQKLKDAQDRIKAYLIPRIDRSDADGIMAAASEGRHSRVNANKHMAECQAGNNFGSPADIAHFRACAADEFNDQDDCMKGGFLPFAPQH